MFFKKDPRDRGAGDEVFAFYDWQLAHPGVIKIETDFHDNFYTVCLGNCMIDLALTIGFCVTGEMRRMQTTRVLQHYHDKLTQYTNGSPPFTLVDVSNAYKLALRAQTVFMATLGAPMWTRLPEFGPQGTKEREENIEKVLKRCYMALEDTMPEIWKSS